ncbi:MAG: cytochrome-c oxidase, cbb3-type subunit III [Lysobacteraceae bacterium]
MSAFWSWFIIVLVVINIAGCAWLLWWTAKRRPGDPAPEQTSHYWDGDITEYNKPLPKWWINLFWLTILFSIGYLVWYPGLGNFAGIGGWSSAGQHDADVAAFEARMAPLLARFEGQPIDVLARDPDAVAMGRSVFGNYCATCHGSDARGARGFPNLADGAWNWGGSPEQILTSIIDGRQGVMAPMGAVLGSEQAITEVVVYTQSLSGRRVDPQLAAAGQPRFAVCAACHGAEGRGNTALGAPDLTDGIWTYGGDFASIRESIVNGRHGEMPPHGPIIGETRARLVGAWVWSLSHPDGEDDAR